MNHHLQYSLRFKPHKPVLGVVSCQWARQPLGGELTKNLQLIGKPSSGGYTLIGARMSPLVTTDAGHEACKQGIGYTRPPRWNKQNTNEQRKNRDCSRPLAAVNLDANDSSKCCVHKREESSYKNKKTTVDWWWVSVEAPSISCTRYCVDLQWWLRQNVSYRDI